MPDRHLNLTCSRLASDQVGHQGPWISCLTCKPAERKVSKCYSCIALAFFQVILSLFLIGPHKGTALVFKVWSARFFRIFFVSLNLWHYGNKSFKTLHLPKSLFNLLSLFDCVSKGHRAGICPSSIRPSVRHPLSCLIYLRPVVRFLSNLGCCLPCAIRPDIS